MCVYHLIKKYILCCLPFTSVHKLVLGLLIQIMAIYLEEGLTVSLCTSHTLIDKQYCFRKNNKSKSNVCSLFLSIFCCVDADWEGR